MRCLEMPGHEMPVHKVPVHEVPAHEVPGYEIPGHEIPGHEMPVHKMLAHKLRAVLDSVRICGLVDIESLQEPIVNISSRGRCDGTRCSLVDISHS